MRVMRVLSLVAGVALIVSGLASWLGRRADLGAERDRRLETSAELLTTQLDASVARITAAFAVATEATAVDQLADALAVPVCEVTLTGRACSSDVSRQVPGATFSAAVDAAAREPRPVVLPVPHALRVVVAVGQGERRLIAPAELDTSPLPAEMIASLVPLSTEPLLSPRTSGAVRMFAVPSMVEYDGGPRAVRTATAAAVHVTGGERALVAGQLVAGALLALLALGGIVGEHRSLQRRATTDALTDLPNRAEFERRATETLARLGRERGGACLLVVDLDRFKVLNDTVGHEAGDRALVAAAERLRHAVRQTDIVGRWGGDEFVVMMPGVADARAVPARAATIADAIAASPPIGSYELNASIGAALFPAHGTTLEALLRAADRAMYAAKVQGQPHHLAEEPSR
jgi:diguanylate cyclase (GGDEF)-like protein